MLERSIQSSIKTQLSKKGCLVYKFDSPGNAGVPDLIVIAPFGVYFLEVKTTTGRLTKLQEHQHERMRAAGALVYVVRSTEAAEAAHAEAETVLSHRKIDCF